MKTAWKVSGNEFLFLKTNPCFLWDLFCAFVILLSGRFYHFVPLDCTWKYAGGCAHVCAHPRQGRRGAESLGLVGSRWTSGGAGVPSTKQVLSRCPQLSLPTTWPSPPANSDLLWTFHILTKFSKNTLGIIAIFQLKSGTKSGLNAWFCDRWMNQYPFLLHLE